MSCKTRTDAKGGAARRGHARKEGEHELQDTNGRKGRRGPPWPCAKGGWARAARHERTQREARPAVATRERRVSRSCKTRTDAKGGAARRGHARKEGGQELQDTNGRKGRRGPPWPRAKGGCAGAARHERTQREARPAVATRERRVSRSCKTRTHAKGGAARRGHAREEGEQELQDTNGRRGRRGPPWPRLKEGEHELQDTNGRKGRRSPPWPRAEGG